MDISTIIEKLPEMHRGILERTMEIIEDSNNEVTRTAMCSRLYGQADILLAQRLITASEYIFIVRWRGKQCGA